MNIYEKLLNIQVELKAPKGQYNSFGKYKYRSCEDILESVKPICKKYNCTLVLSDTLENIGERYYIKATALLIDTESEDDLDSHSISNTAYAREELEKKGMDGSQITGTASSYARKYALNGLFNIDDTKDADTDEFKTITESSKNEFQATINSTVEKSIKEEIKKAQISNERVIEVLKKHNISKLNELKVDELMDFRNELFKGE